MAGCCDHGHTDAVGSFAAPEVVTDGIRTSIRTMQMDCPTEEALIREKLRVCRRSGF